MRSCAGGPKTEAPIDDRQKSAAPSDVEAGLEKIYLQPGGIYSSLKPADLTIIVGSCVAVCVFDPRLSIGGATHYLLPRFEGEGQPSPRYGDVAITQLLEGLAQAGCKKGDLQAQIYGGACVLRAFQSGSRELIGDKNVQLALEVLSREKITVVRQETSGQRGRKITMRTDTGSITCKVIGA